MLHCDAHDVSHAVSLIAGLHLLGTLVTSFSSGNNVEDTALLNELLFVIRYNVPHVSVYNVTSMSPMPTITSNGLSSFLTGLATSSTNNYLYVSDGTNFQVHRIDLSMNRTTGALAWNVPNRPYKLTLTRSGNVLVPIYDSKCVIEYTPDGYLVRTVNHFENTGQAIELSSGLWAILSPSSLCTVLTNGTVTKCYRPVTGQGMAAMAIDTNGYYLVADYPHSIFYMVNPSLTEARLLQLPASPGVNTPNSLRFDQSSGRLFIGESCSTSQTRVLMFKGIW